MEEDLEIGCILRDAVYFPGGDILGAPPEFARNLVQGKSDIDDPGYTEYLDILSVQVPGREVSVEIVRDCPRLRSPADL